MSGVESGRDSGDCVVRESSGDRIGSIGSPLLKGITGLKKQSIYYTSLFINNNWEVLQNKNIMKLMKPLDLIGTWKCKKEVQSLENSI